MKKTQGFSMVEALIALGITGILATVAVVAYIGYQRSAETIDALATISIMRERLAVARTEQQEQLVTCDSLLVRPGDLENSFTDLSIVAIPLDANDPTVGYGGGIVVSARVDSNGGQGVEAAKALHAELLDRSADVRDAVLTDSAASFTVMLTPAGQAFCNPPATQIAAPRPPSGQNPTPTTVAPPTAQPPAVSFSFTTQQQVVDFDNTGTGSVMNVGTLKTGGPMRDLSVEFNVMGGQQVATSGDHGATFLSYGVNGNANEFYAWNPSDLTVRIGGTEYPTGIDTTDGASHRYSILWSSDTGRLQVLVDGVVEFSQDNVAQGYEMPGDGVLALAQDQDRFAIEDGSGVNHGFSPGDAFHGQYFSAAVATSAVDPADLADKTLASVVDKNSGLIADIRMGSNGPEDLTGNHQLKTVGGVQSRTVDVDTSIAIPNPGATLRLNISVSPKGQDQLTDLEISGLLPGSQLSDGAGNLASGASHNILSWDYTSITAQLPSGVARNMRIRVTATVDGVAGDQATAESEQALVLDPSQPLP